MFDTRNSYKAMNSKRDHELWNLYFRRWYSPFWHFFDCAYEREVDARCDAHARGPLTRHLGKFPRKPGERA